MDCWCCLPSPVQARIGRTFSPPSSMTDLSFQMKKIYTNKLLQFEQVLGGWREWQPAGMQLRRRGGTAKVVPALA